MRDLPDPQRAKPCVMVVDDDMMVILGIQARLGEDFRVVGVTEPTQAVDVAMREQPGLILCDINMPGMKGDEVAYALSQAEDVAEIPLVYLTSLVEPDDTPTLEGQFGDHTAVSKGASTAELRALVNQALGLPPDD